MKIPKTLLYCLIPTIFSCDVELIDLSISDEINSNPILSEVMRVKEVVGYMDGIEVAKQQFTYSDDKLLSIKILNKEGNNWVEVVNHNFSYSGNTSIQSYQGGSIEYTTTNNNLASINYFDDEEEDENDGYQMNFSNSGIESFTFFEGNIDEVWSYKSTCSYTNDKIVEINNEFNTPTEPNFMTEHKTIFSYEADKLSGWISDYTVASIDDAEYNEKVEYKYDNNNVSKIIENKWIPNDDVWEIVAEINYTYSEEGHLITQKYQEIGDESTENHLYHYFYFDDFSNDFNEVRYTYENGESNNFILLIPEFLIYKTPNPYFKH